ncbi:MAG: hypothetical protein GY934_14240, partial [Gammaproteobacteria bacterium]|nr:hypothetical protein [Gammaproteobacteria bacterium]
WWILDWLIVNPGLFGINTWTLFAGLALMLWGLSRIARPFFNTSPVHPGKLLLFFILSYIVIDQGSTLMQDIEQWRMEAGNAIYTEITSTGDTSGITVPTIPSTSDPLGTAADLDGISPIRGWEAVATSYFLVSSIDELHQSYPPQNFRIAYCLYNPEIPISGQNVTNAEGCSPRVAWDEWETVDVQMLEELLGFDIDSLTDPIEEFFDWFGITLEIGDNIDTIPLLQHHPENRELAIRQSAAGISRLTLGIIVALFPMIEANISLMLALAASFVYLSLPIVILFGFFLPTEAMVNKLLMQFVNVILRTLVIHGIVAVFMLILMDSALSGTLMSYLGLVGVGLVGGWWMMRLATATMKESMNQS